MTALIALAAADGVFMATDTRRTHVSSGTALAPVSKMKSLPGPTLWAKGGYGSQADILFTLVANDPRSQSGDVDLVAEATYELGLGVYADCKRQAAAEGLRDIGLYALMAGFDKSGQPKLQSIHFGLNEQKAFGSGMRVVMASNTDLAKEILEGTEGRYISSDGRFTTDMYGLGAMKIIKSAMPDDVDLPVEIAVARYRAPLARKMIGEGSLAIHEPEFCLRI